MTETHVGKRLQAVERALLGLPNVMGVGLGWKEIRGEITDTPAWRVYVRQKLPPRALGTVDTVPHRLDGLNTDVLAALKVVPATAFGAPAPRTRVGSAVSNLRAVLREPEGGRGSSGLGTLGFFALANGTRARTVVLVSNRHVLLAHGAKAGDPVYCPTISAREVGYMIRRDSLEPVAEIFDEGLEGNHQFGYPGEPEDDYFVDCATARVSVGRGGQQAVVCGTHRVHPLDVIGMRAPRVRKLGGISRASAGRVLDVAAPVHVGRQSRRLNNILVRADDGSVFEAGDSGALLLNDRDEAIGLLWGRAEKDPGTAYACHIAPVLDRLDVTIITRGLS